MNPGTKPLLYFWMLTCGVFGIFCAFRAVYQLSWQIALLAVVPLFFAFVLRVLIRGLDE